MLTNRQRFPFSTLRAIQEYPPFPRFPVLFANHPQPIRGEPVSDELLDAVQPRAIVVSAAGFPASEQPGRSLRERLARRGVPVFYSRQCGSITLQIRPGGWRLDTRSGGKLVGSAAASVGAR